MITPFAEWCAAIIEVIGVGVITLVSVHGISVAVWRLIRKDGFEEVVGETRQRLGKGILMGLEFLIAADIIHTVAVELSLESITVLSIVVLVRTFLSFTLEAELTGKWPWQQAKSSDQGFS
ncbi:MAG: DUF1622 domain-containing protein [Verrucomicrobiales bacterium]